MRRIALVSLVLAACSGGVKGKQSTTDHYVERVGRGERVGDLQVTSEVSGGASTITFAMPAADWKDPRPKRIEDGTPPPLVVRAGCVLKATDGGKQWKVTPGQTCTLDGKTLTINSGFLWVRDGVLNVDLSGTFDVLDYTLQYPYGIVDPALKLP